jgi:transglutaminase-like putative cysteine protease
MLSWDIEWPRPRPSGDDVRKLEFDYEMRLSFSSPVTEHRFQLRCVPATGPRQQIVDTQVVLDPDAPVETSVDSFDSIVITGYIPQPHATFGYHVTGLAFVDTEHVKPEPVKPLYRFESSLTMPGPEIAALSSRCAARIARLGSDSAPSAKAAEVMDEVFHAFTYAPGSTTVRTTAEQALTQGSGVCQDYAHVMLAACRRLGLSARYIAGLLNGEGATHAWVEVYENGRWIGLDPTHDRMVDDGYITIAHGRDYRDCMLDIGTFSGSNVDQRQWVNASVHEQKL